MHSVRPLRCFQKKGICFKLINNKTWGKCPPFLGPYCPFFSPLGEQRADLARTYCLAERGPCSNASSPSPHPCLWSCRGIFLSFPEVTPEKWVPLQLQNNLWMWEGAPASFPHGGSSQGWDPTQQACQGQSRTFPCWAGHRPRGLLAKGYRSNLDQLTPCGTGGSVAR